MLEIEFEYKDQYTMGEWHKQKCIMPSVSECIEFYGLGKDCEYHILSIKKVPEDHG